jgi:peptide/nickel transport system substrate-binding protein
VAAIGEHTVEIMTKQPDLLLPVRLRNVAIVSKAWAERNGARLPARRDDTAAYTFGHEDGTGPFTLESFDPASKRAVLARNAGWWGLKDYPHNIDRIVLTREPDPERRLRLLLDGEIDLLQDPALDRLDRLKGVPGIKLVRTSGLLVVFLGLDQASAELRTSDVKGRNPFAGRRVRQAVYQAIDIDALIARRLRDAAAPAGMLVAPGITGYDPELDRRLPYDPGRAKALLAEAGYPDGFAVRLDCVAHRQEACRELAAQLAEVGIRMTVDIVPFDAIVPRLKARASDAYLIGEDAAITLDSIDPLREAFGSPPVWFGGATGYANPAVNELFDKIDGELSSPIRDALIEQAWRIVLNDIVVIPLYRPLVVWAMRDTLELPVNPLNGPQFYQARLTSPR